jgi:hypothetical protein
MEDGGKCIWCVDFFDHAEAAAFWGFVGRVEDKVESGFYVSRSDWVAIVEFYVGLEVEDVGQRVRRLPGFGEVAMETHLRVAGEESAEYEAVHPLRLAVGGEAGVEVDGVRFD